MKERCDARCKKYNFDVSQTWKKSKCCVGECRKTAQTIKTDPGIKRFQENKQYDSPTWFFYSGIPPQCLCVCKVTYLSINLASVLNIFLLVNRIFKINKAFFWNRLSCLWFWKTKIDNFSCLNFSKGTMFFSSIF